MLTLPPNPAWLTHAASFKDFKLRFFEHAFTQYKWQDRSKLNYDAVQAQFLPFMKGQFASLDNAIQTLLPTLYNWEDEQHSQADMFHELPLSACIEPAHITHPAYQCPDWLWAVYLAQNGAFPRMLEDIISAMNQRRIQAGHSQWVAYHYDTQHTHNTARHGLRVYLG